MLRLALLNHLLNQRADLRGELRHDQVQRLGPVHQRTGNRRQRRDGAP